MRPRPQHGDAQGAHARDQRSDTCRQRHTFRIVQAIEKKEDLEEPHPAYGWRHVHKTMGRPEIFWSTRNALDFASLLNNPGFMEQLRRVTSVNLIPLLQCDNAVRARGVSLKKKLSRTSLSETQGTNAESPFLRACWHDASSSAAKLNL